MSALPLGLLALPHSTGDGWQTWHLGLHPLVAVHLIEHADGWRAWQHAQRHGTQRHLLQPPENSLGYPRVVQTVRRWQGTEEWASHAHLGDLATVLGVVSDATMDLQVRSDCWPLSPSEEHLVATAITAGDLGPALTWRRVDRWLRTQDERRHLVTQGVERDRYRYRIDLGVATAAALHRERRRTGSDRPACASCGLPTPAATQHYAGLTVCACCHLHLTADEPTYAWSRSA
jgi:hypothetical protein